MIILTHKKKAHAPAEPILYGPWKGNGSTSSVLHPSTLVSTMCHVAWSLPPWIAYRQVCCIPCIYEDKQSCQIKRWVYGPHPR